MDLRPINTFPQLNGFLPANFPVILLSSCQALVANHLPSSSLLLSFQNQTVASIVDDGVASCYSSGSLMWEPF